MKIQKRIKFVPVVQEESRVEFLIKYRDNETFVATLLDHELDADKNSTLSDSYDDRGALMYVCVVIFIYGFSIILMIGSVIKKSMSDHGVSKYMKGVDNLRRMERRQEKYKTRLAMQSKRFRNALQDSGKSSVSLASQCSASIISRGPPDTPPVRDNASRNSCVSLTFELGGEPVNSSLFMRSQSSDVSMTSQTTARNHSKLDTGESIPQVTIDLCEPSNDGLGEQVDQTVVSAYALSPTPICSENISPKFNRKMSSSSLIQLQPLLEADEDAITV